MEHLYDVLGFAARTLLILIASVAVLLVMARLIQRARNDQDDLEVVALHEEMQDDVAFLQELRLTSAERKAARKARRASRPADDAPTTATWVLDFDGDVQASQTEGLARAVNLLVQAAKPGDRVLLRLNSGGGAMHAYGLAAAQLGRLRSKDLPLTIAVDHIAASGGYMMAVEAEEIVASPWALVGSIGVAMEFPNVHRLLKTMQIDWQELTAGEDKRNATVAGEMTEDRRARLRDEIELAHDAFRNYVKSRRPGLQLEEAATGAVFFGPRAMAMGLVDRLATSDEVLLERAAAGPVYLLQIKGPGPMRGLRRLMGRALAAVGLLETRR